MPLGISFTCVTVACFAAYVSFASYNMVEFIVPGGLFGYSLTDPDRVAFTETCDSWDGFGQILEIILRKNIRGMRSSHF